jgi:hypothetical protein
MLDVVIDSAITASLAMAALYFFVLLAALLRKKPWKRRNRGGPD